MTNVGESTPSKRRLLMTITHFIQLYGREILDDSLRQDKYENRIALRHRLEHQRSQNRQLISYGLRIEILIHILTGTGILQILECESSNNYEEVLQEAVRPLTPDNVVQTMLFGNNHRQKIAMFVKKMLQKKSDI